MTFKEAVTIFTRDYDRWEGTPEAHPSEDFLRRYHPGMRGDAYKRAADELSKAIPKLSQLLKNSTFVDTVNQIAGSQNLVRDNFRISEEYTDDVTRTLRPCIKGYFPSREDVTGPMFLTYTLHPTPFKSEAPDWIYKFYKALHVIFTALDNIYAL